MSLGALYVVSGPSGAGKSTVCKLVRERLGINLSNCLSAFRFISFSYWKYNT